MDILKARAPRFAWPEAAVLLLFTLIAFLLIPYHEPWFDETQAWLIVRDSSLKDLLLHRLHYEGAPALWYLLLWMLKLSHVPFRGMQYMGAAIAVAGAYVWLRFNPLPRVLSLLFPLTFFLQYQYAIISRSYVFFPLLAFSLMALYADRRSSPVSFCVLAGLLANGSLHMAAFAAGAVVLYVSDRFRSNTLPSSQFFHRFTLPLVMLFGFFAFSATTAWPTNDGSFGDKIINTLRAPVSNSKLTPVHVRTEDYPPPRAQGATEAALWHTIYPPADASHRRILMGKLLKRAIRLLTLVTVPISTSNLLAFVFLLLLILNLWRRELLLALVPYLLVIAVCIGIQGATHHYGLVWIALVCALWAVAAADRDKYFAQQSVTCALYFSVLVIMLLQVGWSVHALQADFRLPYASGQETATFLKQQPPNKKVAGFNSDSASVNVYFARTPFFNQQVDYWPFSRTHDPDLFADQTLAASPDTIVMAEFIMESLPTNQWLKLVDQGTLQFDNPELTATVIDHGYRLSHRFCGEQFFRNAVEMDSCLAIYERPKTPASETSSPDGGPSIAHEVNVHSPKP